MGMELVTRVSPAPRLCDVKVLELGDVTEDPDGDPNCADHLGGSVLRDPCVAEL